MQWILECLLILIILQGPKMKQHNLGFLTMKIYAIKTYDIFLSYQFLTTYYC